MGISMAASREEEIVLGHAPYWKLPIERLLDVAK